MRDLKFRMWTPKQNNMAYFSIDSCCINNGVASQDELYQSSVMIYTTMDDDNAKEIYENDIVKITNAAYPDVVEYIVVKFNDGAFNVSRYSKAFRQLEVLGNIYEHQHLLTQLNIERQI